MIAKIYAWTVRAVLSAVVSFLLGLFIFDMMPHTTGPHFLMTYEASQVIIPVTLAVIFVVALLLFSRVPLDKRGSVALGHWIFQILLAFFLSVDVGAMTEGWYTVYTHSFRAGNSGLYTSVPAFILLLYYFRRLTTPRAPTPTNVEATQT
jgi:hypothetical protein